MGFGLTRVCKKSPRVCLTRVCIVDCLRLTRVWLQNEMANACVLFTLPRVCFMERVCAHRVILGLCLSFVGNF